MRTPRPTLARAAGRASALQRRGRRILLSGLAPLALWCAASSAQAVEYGRIQADKSQIGFTYQQMGVKMDGRFRRFTAELAFDPAKPAAARAVLDVELASIDAGSPDADQEIVGKSWFDVKSFPRARFVSGTIRALDASRYEVAGKLTIKGVTRDVTVPATFTSQSGTAVFEGTFPIRRGDFTIGEGVWSKFDVVGNDVVVRFRLVAGAK
ncbi:MAG: hypothetical protein RIS35_3413 [Pseudomonadota bacterium]|jgi:polyisoprenoid-binding protein YceI